MVRDIKEKKMTELSLNNEGHHKGRKPQMSYEVHHLNMVLIRAI